MRYEEKNPIPIKKDLEEIFSQIHRGIKEKGGLLNEDDVAEMVREQRNF